MIDNYEQIAMQNKGITALGGVGRVVNSSSDTSNSDELKGSQYRSWAYDIADNPANYGAISMKKAAYAFDEWGLQMPRKLAAHIKEIGLKL